MFARENSMVFLSLQIFLRFHRNRAGDKTECLQRAHGTPKKQSLKCWEEPLFQYLMKNGERCLFLLMREDGEIQLPLWAEGFANRQPQLNFLALFVVPQRWRKGFLIKAWSLCRTVGSAHMFNQHVLLPQLWLPKWTSPVTGGEQHEMFLLMKEICWVSCFFPWREINKLLRAVEFALCRPPALQRAMF